MCQKMRNETNTELTQFMVYTFLLFCHSNNMHWSHGSIRWEKLKWHSSWDQHRKVPKLGQKCHVRSFFVGITKSIVVQCYSYWSDPIKCELITNRSNILYWNSYSRIYLFNVTLKRRSVNIKRNGLWYISTKWQSKCAICCTSAMYLLNFKLTYMMRLLDTKEKSKAADINLPYLRTHCEIVDQFHLDKRRRHNYIQSTTSLNGRMALCHVANSKKWLDMKYY